MPIIHRRTFLERLGLGAGALLLGPSLARFVRDAQAAPGRPKPRLIAFVQSNGINFRKFAPPGHRHDETDFRATGAGGTASGALKRLYVAENVTLPRMFAPLEPCRKLITMVDGLSSQVVQRDHGLWHCALTALPGVGRDPAPNGLPGGPSFDQYVAGTEIGKGTVFPSLLLGPKDNFDRPLENTVFASGRGKFAPQHAHTTSAYQHAFGDLVGAGGAGGAYDRRKALLDHVRADAQKARAALAGPERQKLDHLLGSLEELDRQMARFGGLNEDLRRKVTVAPLAKEPVAMEDRVEMHTRIALNALTAGLTHVIGYSATACGTAVYSRLGVRGSTHEHGHTPIGDVDAPHPLDAVSNFYAGEVLKIVQGLEAVPEGGGTMMDNTLLFWLSDQAEQHHPWCNRWPTLIVSGKNIPLRKGASFFRWPVADYVHTEVRNPSRESVARRRPPGGRCMADLFITLSHVLGVPNDSFGKEGSFEEVTGVLPELVA